MKLFSAKTKISPPLLVLTAATLGLLAETCAQAAPIGDVFVIDLENHNFTQPVTDNATINPIKGCSAAPYINSLITPGNANAAMVSWASSYHNVLAGPTGPEAISGQSSLYSSLDIHPSEPNYLWQEAGSNFSAYSDTDPYGSDSPYATRVARVYGYAASNPSVTTQHLTGLMQAAGISWKSYQEDIDLANATGGNANQTGTPTSTVLPQSSWTLPLSSFSGTGSSYTNPYNGSHQYNFACKHDGTLFFTDTNGSTTTVANTSTTNPENSHHAPLQQLAADLANNAVGRYNLITPDQYNDMHTALSSTYTFTYNGVSYTSATDLKQIAQGDNFLAQVVPMIEASPAFQNNGMIVIWTDETEGTNQDDFNHTLLEVVISPLAIGNGYNVTDNLTHSSDLATLQEIFGVAANTPSGYLNDAANKSNTASGPGTGIQDMADFFQPGTIPQGLTPAMDSPAMPLVALGALAVLLILIGSRFLPEDRTYLSA